GHRTDSADLLASGQVKHTAGQSLGDGDAPGPHEELGKDRLAGEPRQGARQAPDDRAPPGPGRIGRAVGLESLLAGPSGNGVHGTAEDELARGGESLTQLE